GLLGHELGHSIGRHALVGKRYAAVSTSTVERMRLARSLEEEADETGLALIRRAGYDPREMLATLALIEADDMAGRGAVFAWESHPYIRDRRRKLGSELGPAVASEATRNPDRYEEAIADLLLIAAQQELDARRPERARAAIERHLRHRPESGRSHLLLAEYARLTERDGGRSPAAPPLRARGRARAGRPRGRPRPGLRLSRGRRPGARAAPLRHLPPARSAGAGPEADRALPGRGTQGRSNERQVNFHRPSPYLVPTSTSW